MRFPPFSSFLFCENAVIKHIGLIRPALKDAVKNAYIRLNPAELMQKPKKAKTEMHYYNAEQLQKLLSAAMGTPIEVPVVLGIMLGLRRSEIVGLRWCAIDFDKMILSIKQKAITGMVDGKTQTVISTSCISLLANDSRFTMKQIQDYARHANFLTTANVYSHTNIDIKKNELDCITDNFKGFFSNNF